MRILGSRRARGALTVALLVIAARAEATVTQVDGTIVPVTNRMKGVLDQYEPPAGTLDAVKNASEVPQIFKPRTDKKVVFTDIRETADFENSFGWYNIGDDVSTADGRKANLHPVLGCGVEMVTGAGDDTHHGGDPNAYAKNAEEGSVVSVDFVAERTAGRYKGGFIGFYMITPEATAGKSKSSVNCGDFKIGSDNLSLFGFIYFTQKDLNNDGDFVHHLAYTSKTADRFYFGFEDRFRGGDNDFEDMTIQIDGLTPPCVPSAEVCDGIDNNCNGLIDEDPGTIGTGNACLCDGSSACDNGPKFGQCQSGVTRCVAGALTCHATGVPSGELCDGIDNNCNGVVDDNPSGTGGSCDGQDADLCTEGQIVCQNGALVCNDNTAANVETCNNIDDNCNGQVDEGDPGGGGPCGSSIGVCTPGTFHCVGGALQCQGGSAGGPEVCNGLDDNCNGVTDEDPTDVGQSCGASDVGECRLGQTICVGGHLSCAGEIGKSPEVCNNLDDDCDGIIDNIPVDQPQQPCGSSVGACRPGVLVCSMGGLVCTGETGPSPEICDGIDNDCNGIVDDDVIDDGAACGGAGACSTGVQQCISGALQCVGGTTGGTEICNGIDDDCDGKVDEGDLCNGGKCENGQCAVPCVDGEFPCPTGKVCDANNFCVTDLCFGIDCPNDADGNLQACSNGTCQPLCQTVQCPNNLVCRGSDGACVVDTCDYLPKCAANEICVDATCQHNPCENVNCPSGEFCRGGSCVASCEGVECRDTETCHDGACVATGCAVACGGQVCNPTTGACQTNRCVGVVCPSTKECDPLNGSCIANACQGVTCPTGQTCARGECGAPPSGRLVTTGGGGGCNTGGDGSLAMVLAAVALVAGRRLRRGRRAAIVGRPRAAQRPAWLVLSVMLAVLPLGALGGCKINDYCLECAAGDGGTGTGDGGGGTGDGGPVVCDPNQVHAEVCNQIDDNCDGQIDEGFDLQTDATNCGTCGVVCNKPGAQTQCVAGRCAIVSCFGGFIDKDGDIAGPYDSSDGCEYGCFVSNGGSEVCDGIDNDCDGLIDEDTDKMSDPNNCGVCGRTCNFFGAAGHCALGTCIFDPKTDCAPGFLDIDGNQQNGCEYACTPSNGGVEACDLIDNNCDGHADEGFALATDPNNCGRCGAVCHFENATASCDSSSCKFDPATGCAAGFVDANGKQIDGCEYQCTKTNHGVEICDGIDNDCNGIADDNPSDIGTACASTTPPKGACVANGILACSAGHLVCSGATDAVTESCNNIDDDCDGTVDDNVFQACYTGAANTSGIGVCHAGTATCVAGAFGPTCANQVTPSAEQCNNLDDDCNGKVDDAPNGGVITQACYGGLPGTAGIGTCRAGTQTCAFGAFGACSGEVRPVREICGDGLDTDCDGLNDAAEGCLAVAADFRADAPGGSLGETDAGTQHSYDVVLARGGAPLGTNVYAVWSQLVGTTTEVYFRKSSNGGTTWGTIINVTGRSTGNKVKPVIAVAPGAGTTDRIVIAYQYFATGVNVRDIRIQISADAGATFGAQSAALDADGDSFHQAIAISGSNCVIAWEKLDTTTLNRDIESRTSSTGCATFNAETKINVGSSTTTRFAGRPQVGLTSSGGVVWAWREQRANSTRDVFAAAAADLTTAPTANIAIDTDASNDSDFPVLVVNETAAYLTWQDVSTASNGGSDVLFTSSANGGSTWSTPRIIDDATAEVSSSFTPTLAVDPRAAGIPDDVVAIAWEDRRQGTQIFASISSDGGATFSTPLRASSLAGAPITGQTSVPQIAAAGSGVLAVVYQNQPPSTTLVPNPPPHVYVATSIDTGASWTFSAFQLDTGVGPAIAPQVIPSVISAKPTAVAYWTDFRTGLANGDIYGAVAH